MRSLFSGGLGELGEISIKFLSLFRVDWVRVPYPGGDDPWLDGMPEEVPETKAGTVGCGMAFFCSKPKPKSEHLWSYFLTHRIW